MIGENKTNKMAFKKNRMSEIEREEMIMKMQDKITAPLQWTCSEPCKIIDLKEQHYQQVLNLIKVKAKITLT